MFSKFIHVVAGVRIFLHVKGVKLNKQVGHQTRVALIAYIG